MDRTHESERAWPPPPPIADNVKRLRKEKQLSLDDLSALTGVSKAMLSQIELDRVNPTVAILWKIACGLQVELAALLEGPEVGRRCVVNRNAQVKTLIATDNGNMVFKVLSPVCLAEDLPFYQVTQNPGCVHTSGAHPDGTEEYVFVQRGCLRVITGKKVFELENGDFLVFPADAEHIFETISADPAEYLLVTRYGQDGTF